jgi:Arc/MetJ-type ribon-helix-helix transcriptional regulator
MLYQSPGRFAVKMPTHKARAIGLERPKERAFSICPNPAASRYASTCRAASSRILASSLLRCDPTRLGQVRDMTGKKGAWPAGAITVTRYARLEEFVAAFAQGHINLLILVGPPGLAKSRTVRGILADSASWIEGNATAFGRYLRAAELMVSLRPEGLTMTNNISRENARYLQDAVQSGVYPSEETALNEAISLLKKRDQLRADVRTSIEQADRGELLPADQVFARLEERARQIESAARMK